MTDDETREVVLYANNIPYATLTEITTGIEHNISITESKMRESILSEIPKSDQITTRMKVERIPFWELVHLCGFWKAIRLYFERRKT